MVGSIQTLADLQGQVTGWLNRSDLSPAQALVFIQWAQSRLEGEIRLREMESSIGAVPDSNGNLSSIPVPADFLEAQRIEADGTAMQMTTPENLLRQVGAPAPWPWAVDPCGIPPGIMVGRPPAWFARKEGNFIFVPYPQQYATLYYYARFPTLVNPTDTNLLLTTAPEVLMWGALSYAGDYFRMDEANTWEERYQGRKEAIKELADDADEGGGPQVVQGAYGSGDGYI